MHPIQTNSGLFAFIGDIQGILSLTDGGGVIERKYYWALEEKKSVAM